MLKKMVYYQRYHQWRKGDVPFVCENSKRVARPKLLFLVFLSFMSFSFILAPLFFPSAPTLSLLCKFLSFFSLFSTLFLLCFSFFNVLWCILQIHLVLKMKGLFLHQMYMLLFVPLSLMGQFAVIEVAFVPISV